MLSSTTVLDAEHLDHVVAHFSRFGELTYDVETVPPLRGVPAHNTITWLSMATHGMTVSIPMGHERGKIIGERKEPTIGPSGKVRNRTVPVWSNAPEQLRPSQVFEAIEPLLFSDRLKVCHNAAFDIASVAKYYDGAVPSKPWHDTFISSVLLDENRLNGLKPRIKQLYKLDYDKDNVGKKVETYAFSRVARYAYMDAKYTWLLYQRERDLIGHAGLSALLDLELGVLETVISMALAGAPVDGAVLAELGVQLDARLVETEAAIYKGLGKKVNLNSPQQKAVALYGPKAEGNLGLRPTTLTKGGKAKAGRGEKLLITDYSTDADSLEPHKKHLVVARFLDYQRDAKLKGTYVTGVLGDPEDPDEKPCLIVDGRVHGAFKQMGARTGRFSSAGPNLQNIPSRGVEGKKIRTAYRALPGHKLVVADYGQIELVLLAHFIGYGALYDGFHQGIDAHTMTASLVFGVPFDDVTKAYRAVAKGLNFAIVYGAGPTTVAEMAGISVAEAKRHMKVHREMFPEIYKYRAHVIETARRQRPPHTATLLGRIRRIPELRSADDFKRSSAERQIFNAKIQGSGADVVKKSMVRLLPLLPDRAELLMTVHDELVCHGPEDQVSLIEAALREAMLGEGIQKLLCVPLTADISVADNWAEAK
ncbi:MULTISPECIES: DNA polymerase [Streptosporangium]|uniref:DNA polymerase I n=1 Tax=Streptosporangium brasiliense TaxID=47480 RepID=A0ABT9RNZ9_9ACTN|nr:DNA polymerase [Streptosporangium brasiliense]MDP9870439.1 DNA polymerase I-like protein with 3'-5' exonuclease and polymerase domains [Streptosporangium brasiliense]